MEENDLIKNNMSIEERISEDTQRVICKSQISPIAWVLTFVGVALFALSVTPYVPEGMVSLIVSSLGILLFIVGVVKLFNKEVKFFDKDTMSQLEKKIFFFENSDTSKVIHLYKEKNFEEMANLKQTENSGIVMHLYGAEEGSLYYSLLMKYEPYEYVAVQDLGVHTDVKEIESLKKLSVCS